MSTHKDTFKENINNSIESTKSNDKQAVTNLGYAINNVKYECVTPNIRSYRSSIEYLKIKF